MRLAIIASIIFAIVGAGAWAVKMAAENERLTGALSIAESANQSYISAIDYMAADAAKKQKQILEQAERNAQVDAERDQLQARLNDEKSSTEVTPEQYKCLHSDMPQYYNDVLHKDPNRDKDRATDKSMSSSRVLLGRTDPDLQRDHAKGSRRAQACNGRACSEVAGRPGRGEGVL